MNASILKSHLDRSSVR